MELAPIVIFTFNRLEHTKRTIEALQSNILAKNSDIFIFSDEGRCIEERMVVREVRKYLKSINGFKSINIIEAKENKGLAKSIIEGVTEIINDYGKVIVLEDDLITSQYFLKYMNEALNTYKDRRDIWSISGYMPNIEIPNDYKDDICMIKRASSWGWGTWKDRWELNDWELNDYYSFKNSKKMIKEFNKSGNDLTYMLEDQIKGRINSWAIRWVYSQFKNNMWTIYPIKSFIENIGNDFSGTHCIATNKYNVELSRSMIKLNKNIKINEQICMSFKSKYDLNIVGYIGVVIKKIGLYRPARKLRNKMFKIIKYKEYK